MAVLRAVTVGGLTAVMMPVEDAVLGRQQHRWRTSGDDSGEARWRVGSGEWYGGGLTMGMTPVGTQSSEDVSTIG